MSLDLTIQEADEICVEAEQHCPPAVSTDHVETVYTIPSKLGNGYEREVELCPGLNLNIFDMVSYDLTLRFPENNHLVQFSAYLSGVADSGDYLQITPQQGYVGGSGIQTRHFVHMPRSHRQIGIDIHMTPALFQQFFANIHGELPASLQPLVQGNNWQQRFSPTMTGAMRTVVQQIIDCPFLGSPKQAYLQGKVFELIALQLDSLFQRDSESITLKSETVARIHYAAEILRSHFENPPSQTELAQRVGIGYCTLHKGFREIFKLTPFAYLTRYRMEQAEQLLRQPGNTVAEVANRVGYANPAKFAKVFKRHFDLTPQACRRGGISR